MAAGGCGNKGGGGGGEEEGGGCGGGGGGGGRTRSRFDIIYVGGTKNPELQFLFFYWHQVVCGILRVLQLQTVVRVTTTIYVCVCLESSLPCPSQPSSIRVCICRNYNKRCHHGLDDW